MVSLSRSYLEMRNTERGLAYLLQARPLAQQIKNTSLESMILHNLAAVYGIQGDNLKAIEMFQQSLPLLEAEGSNANLIVCLSNLGSLTFRAGDFLQSLEYLDRAIQLQTVAGDKIGLAVTLDTLAEDYAYLGQYERALELAIQAVHASEETGDLRIRARNKNNLGSIYGDLGKLSEQKICNEQALNLFQQAEDENGQAFSLLFLSHNRDKAGDKPQAAALNLRARQLFLKTKDQDGEAATWVQSGDMAQESRRSAEALGDYRQALALDRAVSNIYEEAVVLARIGSVEEEQGDLDKAEQFYEQALLRQESLRASLGDLTTTKTIYQKDKFSLYQRYITLLLRTNQNARAFEWAQKAKARALIDLMKAENSHNAQSMTAEDRRQSEELKRRDKALSQQWLSAMGDLEDLKRQTKPDLQRRQKAERQTLAIRLRQQQFEADWRTFQEQLSLRSPHLALQGPAHTVTLAETGALLPEDTALLEYAVVNTGMGKAKREEVVLFVVTRQSGRVQLERLPRKDGVFRSGAEGAGAAGGLRWTPGHAFCASLSGIGTGTLSPACGSSGSRSGRKAAADRLPRWAALGRTVSGAAGHAVTLPLSRQRNTVSISVPVGALRVVLCLQRHGNQSRARHASAPGPTAASAVAAGDGEPGLWTDR